MASPAEASAPKGDLKFQVCTRTMMDTTDPDITFDENGVCNYWREYEAFQATLPGAEERERRLRKLIGQTKAWHYRKWDLVNFKAIHKAFGERPMKMLPALGVWQWAYYCWVKGVRMVEILDLIDFNKPRAKQFLIDALGWRDYGGKHHESIFTRFCQGYILPQKFDIDKREAHLSSLILSGQVTREAALAELQQPAYDEMLQQQDKVYVAKKLGSSDAEFDAVLSLPNRKHQSYGTDNEQRKLYLALTRAAQPVTRLAKKFLRKA